MAQASTRKPFVQLWLNTVRVKTSTSQVAVLITAVFRLNIAFPWPRLLYISERYTIKISLFDNAITFAMMIWCKIKPTASALSKHYLIIWFRTRTWYYKWEICVYSLRIVHRTFNLPQFRASSNKSCGLWEILIFSYLRLTDLMQYVSHPLVEDQYCLFRTADLSPSRIQRAWRTLEWEYRRL